MTAIADRRANGIRTRNKPVTPGAPYISDLEKAAAGGVATLDETTILVPASQLGTGTPTGAKALLGDQSWGDVATQAEIDAEEAARIAADAAHVAAADPHAQYQRESEKNVANGYPGLSAGSKVDGAQQTYGVAVNTACQGNDARLSDARTPTVHATSHDAGGTDAIRSEGNWTPTDASGAGLAFAAASGSWEKNGRQVIARGQVTFPGGALGALAAKFAGLPFNVAAGTNGDVSEVFVGQTSEATVARGVAAQGTDTVSPRDNVDNTITNNTLSGDYIRFCVIYRV